ncbi:MAG: ABC transporter ATP-binding protein [Firmicutes bacterium]|nr:ABC transporter ATP-binding protein [Bacillota bacterium]
MEVLKVENLNKSYTGGRSWQNKDISITLNEGEIVGFLGMNGMGKTTLLKSITGIHSFDEGTVAVCGYDLLQQPLLAKAEIGFVPDNHSTFEKLTGREFVNFSADVYGVPTDIRQARIAEYLNIFKLEHAFDRQIKSYSHGMKQKIAIMASFIHSPKLWVLDEPLVGLDVGSQREVLTILLSAKENGSSVFFSSHNLDIVERICDRAFVIHDGVLIKEYNIRKFKEKSKISLEEEFVKITEVANEEK